MDKYSKVYLNRHEFGTVSGLKFLELHYADLTEFYHPADVLIIASYENHVGSVTKAFECTLRDVCSISLDSLYEDAEIDLHRSLGVWLSKEIKNEKFGFKRIACVDINEDEEIVTPEILESRIKNVFAMFNLAYGIGIDIESAAMPVIGSCLKNVSNDEILRILVEQSRNAMEKTYSLEGIYIVDNDREKVMDFDCKMNELLNRSDIDQKNVFSDESCDEILCDIWSKIKSYTGKSSRRKYRKTGRDDVIEELEMRVESRELRQFELCVLARKLLEYIIYDVAGEKAGGRNLFQKIEYLRKADIASQRITSYMHVVRTFGNAGVHADDELSEISVDENHIDRHILVECIQRIVDYWVEEKYIDRK